MPSALGGLFGGGGKQPPSTTYAPQPIGLNTSTPGYSIGTGVNSNGYLGTTLNTGGSFGQDAFNTSFPQFLTTLGNLGNTVGAAGQQYLSDIGYSNTGSPDPNAPFLSPLQQIENARQSAMSTLSNNLAQRGVLGSSFASDAMTRQDMAYQQLKAQTQNQIAQNVLQSKFATADQQAQFINQQQQVITTALDKEFRDFSAANGLTTNFANLTSGLSEFDQSLAAQQAAGAGSFLGGALGLTNGGLGNLLGIGGMTGSSSGGGILGLLGLGGGAGAGAGAAAGLTGAGDLIGGGAAGGTAVAELAPLIALA